MTAFLIGFAISAIAAIPPLILARASGANDFGSRMKRFVIGLAVRFAVIGLLLLLLFRISDIARIPVVFGVLAAYFTSFGLEVYLANRQYKTE